MSGKTIIELAEVEQAGMLRELRRSRYGYLLALHVLLLCAAGHSPTLISRVLFCSRASVYRIVDAYRSGTLGFSFDDAGEVSRPMRARSLTPKLRRSLLSILKHAPRALGWCRTRWSCATVALELKARLGVEVSGETVRRWMGEMGWVWKRAKLVARDDDAGRVAKLARIRAVIEGLGKFERVYFADELDIHLLAKVGYEWMLKGTQVEVMTPGKNEKQYLAGALDWATGLVTSVVGARKTNDLFLDLLEKIDAQLTLRKVRKIYVVVDNYGIHKAAAVKAWLKRHPRFELLFLPTYCPRANPIERVFGDVHDRCTRNHRRTRLSDLVRDVQDYLTRNGPWQYRLSEIYFTPEVTAEVETYNRSRAA